MDEIQDNTTTPTHKRHTTIDDSLIIILSWQ
jgi:hypothetical protein